MKYISHLDILRLFQRSSRRAALPVEISQGFSPRMRISIEPALKLGVESENLFAKFKLTSLLDADEFKNRLQAQLPQGIDIIEVKNA
ncbi:MAG: TIGR03936 family radical SAM-associated protein [Candidatus Omnitrophota bacterium]